MSVTASMDASSLPPRDLDNDTCCPEEAELVPCSACYEKAHRDAASKALPKSQLSLLLAPLAPPEPQPVTDDASTSLQRVSPPEIPHGHAASAPEDIRHHEAHARQLPAPNPPDPRATSGEGGSGRSKQPQVEAVETQPTGRRRPHETEGKEGAVDSSPLPSPSSHVTSSLPAFQTVSGGMDASSFYSAAAQSTAASTVAPASAAVGAANAGDSTQSGFFVAPALDSHIRHPQYYQASAQSLYVPQHPSPSPYYEQQSPLSQQQPDLYSAMYSQLGHLQSQSAHMPSAPYGHLLPHSSSTYQPSPVTMAGPNGGTFVYFPNAASQPQVSPPMPQAQMSPLGYMGHYYQAQSSIPASQPAHMSHPAQSHAVSMQQPIAYVNGIPMYLSPAPPGEPETAYPQHYSHAATAHHSKVSQFDGPFPSNAASTASTVSSTPSSPSPRGSDAERSLSTYKTEICRSHQYSGCCEYGSSCQFAHGLDELRTREVDVKFKTERCKNFHQFGPSTCWYGPRCKFIHDEFRVRVGPLEFWLVSPRENMVRVEKVDAGNAPRLSQLAQLIAEQAGAAQQAAHEFMQQMAAVRSEQDSTDALCSQLSHTHLHGSEPVPRLDAAARFLKAIVSPHHGGLHSSTTAPINVQAMQVLPSHHGRGPKSLGMGGPLSQYGAGGNGHSAMSPFLSASGPPHQQSGGFHGNGASPTAPAAYQHPPPRLPSPFTRRGVSPHHSHQPQPSPYSPSPLSVLSNLLTPQALQLLSLNGCGGLMGRVGEEPKRRKRIRKKKRAQPRAPFGRAEDDSACSEAPDAEREDTEQHTGDQSSDDEDADTEVERPTDAAPGAAAGHGHTLVEQGP